MRLGSGDSDKLLRYSGGNGLFGGEVWSSGARTRYLSVKEDGGVSEPLLRED